MAPLGTRFEGNDGFEHGQRGRIGRSFRVTGLSQHLFHFREPFEDAIGGLEQLLGFANRDPGHGGRHVEDHAFVERWHEFRTQVQEYWNGNGNHRSGRTYNHPLPTQRPPHHRFVHPHEPATDDMFVFGANPSDHQRIHRPAEPPGAEDIGLKAHEQQTQSWVQRNGHAGGNEHGQRLRVGQGFKHPPFLRFQSKHRQKREAYNQQSKKGGSSDFLDGREHNGAVLLPPPRFFPEFKLLMRLFSHHHGSIHQLAEGDGHTCQRHNVGADSQEAQGNERNQHHHRHGNDRYDRTGKMPEEYEDNQHDSDNNLKDGSLDVADCAVDELRTVIDRNDFDTLW